METDTKKKILFVGAAGEFAERTLPFLSHSYDIVGIFRNRSGLQKYCIDAYEGDLRADAPAVFQQIYAKHSFDAIIWNPVLYAPGPLLARTRESLEAEFDLAVLVPLECLRNARKHGFRGTFIFITSLLAYGRKTGWASYSITKRAQIFLAEYLNSELAGEARCGALALDAIAAIEPAVLVGAVIDMIESPNLGEPVRKIERDRS